MFGGKLVIPDNFHIADPDALIHLINQHSVSHTLMTPALYMALLNIVNLHYTVNLKVSIVAGESISQSLLDAHQESLPEDTIL